MRNGKAISCSQKKIAAAACHSGMAGKLRPGSRCLPENENDG